jgi:hypothetical protein
MEKGVRRRFPTGKISETLLSFAEPLLQELPMEHLVRHVESALAVASVVWNAVVLADVRGEDQHLADARRRLETDPEGQMLTEMLVARKRALFGDDVRLIGRCKVRRTADGFSVRVNAHDPNTLPRG